MDCHERDKQDRGHLCPGSAFVSSRSINNGTGVSESRRILSHVIPSTENKTAMVGDAESEIPANRGVSISTESVVLNNSNRLSPSYTPCVSSKDTVWSCEESKDSQSNTSRCLSTGSERWRSRSRDRHSTRRDQCHERQRSRQRSRELYRSTRSQRRSRETESDPDRGCRHFSRDNFDRYTVSRLRVDRRERRHHNFDDRENDRRERRQHDFDDREDDRRERRQHDFDDREDDRGERRQHHFDDRENDRRERRQHDFDDRENDRRERRQHDFDDRENDRRERRQHDFDDREDDRRERRQHDFDDRENDRRERRQHDFDDRSNSTHQTDNFETRRSAWHGSQGCHDRESRRPRYKYNGEDVYRIPDRCSSSSVSPQQRRFSSDYHQISHRHSGSNYSRSNYSRSSYSRSNYPRSNNSWPSGTDASGSRHRCWGRRETNENAFSLDNATEIHKNSEKKEISKSSATLKKHHSVSRLLLSGYQRGEVDMTRMRKTVVSSTASSLQQADHCSVFPYPEACDNLEHMEHMSLNKDHNHLLCMWSVKGTALKQVQTAHIKHHAKTRCGELPLEFTLSDIVLHTFGNITSLCWIDFPGYPDTDFILYTVNHRLCHDSMGVAHIYGMNASTGKVIDVDFSLGYKNVLTCTWNTSKQWLGAGLDQGCQIVDVNTRNNWHLGSCGSKVLSQAFSKVDGGQLLYCGLYRGALLMHDIRRHTRQPITVMSCHEAQHQSMCDVKLTSDESFIYTSDVSGQIRRVDLRMRRTVLTYDGLCNQRLSLPFHIDETQTILYAAGMDCYTKIWSLDSGELLHSIPPPYTASPSRVPAVQFSDHWGGPMGDIGMVMGANTDMYLYSSGI